MIRPVRTASGRPLIALAGLVTCWIGARVAVWDLPEAPAAIDRGPARLIELASVGAAQAAARGAAHLDIARFRNPAAARARVTRAATVARSNSAASSPPTYLPYPASALGSYTLAPVPVAAPAIIPRKSPAVAAGDPSAPHRWSADVWLALRQGGASPGQGRAALPLYGASQAGAVLRYDLVPGTRHRPAAYARVVQALAGSRENDLAAGLAARLLPGVPATAHLEARVSDRNGKLEVRPAAFVAAGFDQAMLPLGMGAHGYAQAGYVGGSDATGFIDGSLVAERKMLGRSGTEFAAGAGLWGGAQRGAARLDLGPSASLRFPLGSGTGRLAVDYRVRVAGNAAPASGAALTLSAGF